MAGENELSDAHSALKAMASRGLHLLSQSLHCHRAISTLCPETFEARPQSGVCTNQSLWSLKQNQYKLAAVLFQSTRMLDVWLASPSLTGTQWGWLLAVFNASLDEPVDEDVSKCNARYESHIDNQHALPGSNPKGIPPATSRCHRRAGTRGNPVRRSVCNPRLANI